VGDPGRLEQPVEGAATVGVPVAQVVHELFGVLVEQGIVDVVGSLGPVEEPVDLGLVVGRHDERRVVPGVHDPTLGQDAVDPQALGGVDVVVLVDDLFAVLVADVVDGEGRLVDEGHEAVDALGNAGEVLRPAERAPADPVRTAGATLPTRVDHAHRRCTTARRLRTDHPSGALPATSPRADLTVPGSGARGGPGTARSG
jgi:hypothetical protein